MEAGPRNHHSSAHQAHSAELLREHALLTGNHLWSQLRVRLGVCASVSALANPDEPRCLESSWEEEEGRTVQKCVYDLSIAAMVFWLLRKSSPGNWHDASFRIHPITLRIRVRSLRPIGQGKYLRSASARPMVMSGLPRLRDNGEAQNSSGKANRNAGFPSALDILVNASLRPGGSDRVGDCAGRRLVVIK